MHGLTIRFDTISPRLSLLIPPTVPYHVVYLFLALKFETQAEIRGFEFGFVSFDCGQVTLKMSMEYMRGYWLSPSNNDGPFICTLYVESREQGDKV